MIEVRLCIKCGEHKPLFSFLIEALDLYHPNICNKCRGEEIKYNDEDEKK